MNRLDKVIQRSVEIDNPLLFPVESDEAKLVTRDKAKNIKKNFLVLWAVASLVLLAIFGRVFYLQAVRSGYYQEVAENNRIRSIVIKAPRGIIRDKNGEILARNVPSFDAVFVPAELPKEPSADEEMFRHLAEVIDYDQAEMNSLVKSVDIDSKQRFLLKENISEEAALILEEKYDLYRGIYVEKTARRDYVDGQIFSPLIGYDGKITREELIAHPNYLMTDYVGKNGLELTYEKYLHGRHGEYRMEVDSNGEIQENLSVSNPVPGDVLQLHLDAGLQRKTYDILKQILENNQEATAAVAVAIDPKSGGILSLVNVPSYDNNLFAKGISPTDYSQLVNDDKRPMMNRAISGEYPPGSTFKPMMAAAALEDGIIAEDTIVGCNGHISVGSWNFPDWSTHGPTDVRKAIAESCDVFFYAIGGGWDNIRGMGMNRMADYAKGFGLGSPVGIDLPSEGSGLVPTEEWKLKKFGEKWYVGDNYHCSIGQGFVTATPLQMANSTAIIANGGTFFPPHVVERIIRSSDRKDESVDNEPIKKNVISANNLRVVREGMRQTVTEGSGRSLAELKVATAGKTGTAQFGNEDKTHSWYISFAPYDDPQIAMVVLFEGGGEGHDWAVPATKDIYRWYFDEERGTNPTPSEENGNIPTQ